MMMTMFIVVLVLFLSSAVLKEFFNDYDVNHSAQTEIIEKKEQQEIQEERGIFFIGTEDNGYFQVMKEWAGYRKKSFSVFTSLDEAYELNDSNCYRIRRLEPDLYYDYAPTGYNCNNAITYQWVEERPVSVKAHYNFYFAITHSSINKKSLSVYLLVVLLTAVCGNAIYALVSYFAAWLIHLL